MQPTHSRCFPQRYSLNPWQHYTNCLHPQSRWYSLPEWYILIRSAVYYYVMFMFEVFPWEFAQVSSLLQRHPLIWCLCGRRPPMMCIRPFRAWILCFICFFTRRFLTLSSEGRCCQILSTFLSLIWDWKLEDFSRKKILKIRAGGSLCAWSHMYVNVCMCTFPQVSRG